MDGKHRALIIDPFAGISGDMFLGALIDLGLSTEWLTDLVSRLGLPNVAIDVDAVKRGPLAAKAVTVSSGEAEPERHLDDVLEIVDRSSVGPPVQGLVSEAFRRLARVEGELHGVSPERVHFHEVGGVDAIVDIVGAVAGVFELGAATCYTRAVAVGRGWTTVAHGRLPLPAPATLKLLEGLPVQETDLEGELTTPTGALLVSVLSEGRAVPDPFAPLRSGFGAGSRDPETHPNCLRLILADIPAIAGPMVLLQCDLDDMSPEDVPFLLDGLRAAGAADVWTHPIGMKKGRTGIRVEALAETAYREPVAQTLLRHSTTLGLRFWSVARETLPRETRSLEWRGQRIRIKSAIAADGHVKRKPEYEDLERAARATGMPLDVVRRQVERLIEPE